MNLHLATSRRGTAAVVSVKGEIDNYTAPQLRTALADALDTGAARLVVDLSETDFLDSSGLGALVGATKGASRRAADVVVVCPRPHLRRLFEISRLVEVLPLFDTVDDAVDDAAG